MHEYLIFCMQHSVCCTFYAGTLKRHARDMQMRSR